MQAERPAGAAFQSFSQALSTCSACYRTELCLVALNLSHLNDASAVLALLALFYAQPSGRNWPLSLGPDARAFFDTGSPRIEPA